MCRHFICARFYHRDQVLHVFAEIVRVVRRSLLIQALTFYRVCTLESRKLLEKTLCRIKIRGEGKMSFPT